MITHYAAWRNSDMEEGKGPMVMDSVFTKEADAWAYVDTKEGVFGRKPEHGWQNSDMGDWTVKPFYVKESVDDTAELAYLKRLNDAYAKLTPAERNLINNHITTEVRRRDMHERHSD